MALAGPNAACIDDDLTANVANAGRGDLLRQEIQAGERVARGEDCLTGRIRVGMVGLGVFDLVRFCRPAAHGEVADRHEDEVPFQNALRLDGPATIDGRLETVVRASASSAVATE